MYWLSIIAARFIPSGIGRVRHLLPLVVLFASCELRAQLQAPRTIDLHFRLYGKDARPITEKECTVFGGTTDIGGMSRWPVQTVMRGSNLDVTYSTYDRYNDYPRFTIIHRGDTMRVRSACSLDSLPFMPGNYVIPGGFDVVLEKVRVGRARVIPGWPELRVASIDSLPPNLGITGQPRPSHFSAEVYPGEPANYGHGVAAANVIPGTHVAVIAYRGNMGSRHILFSSDSCQAWPTRITPPPDDGYFVGVKFVDMERGWVQILSNEGRLVYSMTTDHGRNWLTSDFAPSWARDDGSGYSPFGRDLPRRCFIDSRTGFEAQWNYDYICNVLGTKDGGTTWEPLFSAPSLRPGVLRFFNARVGVLMLARSIFLTRNAGITWRYIPIPGENGPLKLHFSDPNARELFDDFFFVDEGAICLSGPTAIWWMNLPPA